jgi:retinoid hydroxylase
VSPAAVTLPPGRRGLPLLGETLDFAKNPFDFIAKRIDTHGRVFRTHLLGRPTVVIAGPEATSDFIDPERVMRAGSMPANIEALFAGKSLPLLDGDQHRARKSIVLQGFSRAALTAYLPSLQAIVERAFAGWATAGEIRWLDEMKRLAIEVICSTVIGMEPGDEMERLRRDYGTITDAFAALPIDLPGTRYRQGLRARDRVLAVLTRVVRERRASPTDDGLSRMLAARPADGVALADEDAVLELHHVVIAGYIVFAELATIVQQLTAHQAVRSRLAEEVLRLAPAGPVTMEQLLAMPYLRQVVMETKRVCPIIPAIFGKAKADFDVDGKTIPAGWKVLWAVLPNHTTCSLYSDPARFDPDRFAPERAEDRRHLHAFVPQGAGPAIGHRCPGLDFATILMQIFTIVLLRGFDWQLSPQRFELDYSKTPPEPSEGLRARVARSA